MTAARHTQANRRRLALAVMALFAATPACGVVVDSEPAVSIAEEEAYAATFAHTICDRLGPCCALSRFGPVTTTCVPLIEDGWRTSAEAARKAGAHFDRAKAKMCLEQMAAWVAECPAQNEETVQSRIGACYEVYVGGTSRPGDRCEAGFASACNDEKTSGIEMCATTKDAAGMSVQACIAYHEGREGDACYENLSERVSCGPGLTCVLSTCVRIGALGASCNGEKMLDCVSGTTCDRVTKTCVVPSRAPGESCAEDEDCENFCVAGRCTAGARMYATIGSTCAAPP